MGLASPQLPGAVIPTLLHAAQARRLAAAYRAYHLPPLAGWGDGIARSTARPGHVGRHGGWIRRDCLHAGGPIDSGGGDRLMGLVEQGSMLAGLAKELVWAHQATSDGRGGLVCQSHNASWPCHVWRAARDVCREAGIAVDSTMPWPSAVRAGSALPLAFGDGLYSRSDRERRPTAGAWLTAAPAVRMGSVARSLLPGSGRRSADRGMGDTPWS
jgi:hypothetical protein